MAYASAAPPDEPAVSMPTTSPWASNSGPPESPARTLASVSTMPVRVSGDVPSSDAAVTEAPSPVIAPSAALNVPVPPAFPTAVTCEPTITSSVSGLIVVSPVRADHGRLVGLAGLRDGDLDRTRALDHVVVRQHPTARGQDHAGAGC